MCNICLGLLSNTDGLEMEIYKWHNYLAPFIWITRSYAALRAADLDWIIGPGYSFGGYILEKNHEKPRKTMRNHEKPWNNHETMGGGPRLDHWARIKFGRVHFGEKPWNTNLEPWKTMKTMKNQPGTMKNHEKPTWNMENHEKPWKTMKSHEKPRKTLRNHEKPWKTIKNHEKPWKNHEKPWKTMKNHERPWKTMKN